MLSTPAAVSVDADDIAGLVENDDGIWYSASMKKGTYITLDVERLPEGYYVATSRDVQGLVAEAKTFEKTIEIAQDIARVLLQAQKGKVKARTMITYPMLIPA